MKTVTLVEMGLRDGLQNEAKFLSVSQRLQIIEGLLQSGVKRLELGAFVKPEKVPQMKDSKKIIQRSFKKWGLRKLSGASALVPNLHGFEEALETPLKEIAVFTAASETFCQKNIDCSIRESLERFAPVIKLAEQNKIRVRGYVSTGFGCPYEGEVAPKKVAELVHKLWDMGCFEVSLGDTIGVASPWQVEKVLNLVLKKTPVDKIAGHFHDTRGTALANITRSYEMGVRVFDSSIGGLGGCPYAPGSSGNVATEDVVYMFEKSGIKTHLDLKALQKLSLKISSMMQKKLDSKLSRVPLL
jgi:hydroxymethylglutaryl-CoA lyase